MKTTKKEFLTLKERIQLMLVLIIFALLASFSIQAQTAVKRNESGQFVSIKEPKDSADKKTGDFYQNASGINFPVYVSKSGKFYCLHVSKKTGKTYKHYLTVTK